ncbi:unnamed protein product, partial [Staurois parvus]
SVRAATCSDRKVHSFEWTLVPQDTQGTSPRTTWKIAVHMGTEVPSTIAISSADGVPLQLLAPTLRVPHSSVWVVRLQAFVRVPHSSVWVVRLQVFVQVPHSSVWAVQLQVLVRVPHSSVWAVRLQVFVQVPQWHHPQ